MSVTRTDKTRSKLLQERAEAFDRGDLYDVSFLVGPDGDEKLVKAVKSDLLAASPFFGALFRHSREADGPLRLKHVQPRILEILMRHLSTASLEEDSMVLEDTVSLVHAADEFLLDTLKQHYLSMLEEKIDSQNVWTALNKSIIPEVKAICCRILSNHTQECLVADTFLDASQESLVFLLQIPCMNIGSENDLVKACLTLANTKPEEERLALVKSALPHLRLLTLSIAQIEQELFNILAGAEVVELTLLLNSPHSAEDLSTSGLFCTSTLSRSAPLPRYKGAQVFEILPAAVFFPTPPGIPMYDALIQNKFCNVDFIPTDDILLRGLDILTPFLMGPVFTVDGSNKLHIEKVAFEVTVKVWYTITGRCIHKERIKLEEHCNSWVHVDLSKHIVVPQNGHVCIDVVYDKKYSFMPVDHYDALGGVSTYDESQRCLSYVGVGRSESYSFVPTYMIKSVYYDEITPDLVQSVECGSEEASSSFFEILRSPPFLHFSTMILYFILLLRSVVFQ